MANRHKFLFLYNERCKKVELENDNPNGVSMEELMEKASNLFGIDQTNILLQKWDSGYECFIDIDGNEPADETISGGIKIKVQSIVHFMPVHIDMVQPIAAAQPVVSEKPEDTSTEDEPDAGGRSRDVEMEVEEKDQGEAQIYSHERSRLRPVSCWIVNWKLPDLPPAIHKKLLSLPLGNDLRVSERSTIFDIIFKSVMQHKNVYPKPAEYTLLIDQLFKRYPRLDCNLKDVNCGSRKVMYRKKLTYYFQNKRDVLRKDELTTVNFAWRKKRQSTKPVCKATASSAAPAVWGVQNYLPSMPDTEDDDSIKKHIKIMQDEFKKKYPDIKRVATGMDMTLSARRNTIVKENATIQDIKDTYPWLFQESQLMAEMDRLIGSSEDKGFKGKMTLGFKKFGMAIVKYGKRLKAKSTPQCFKILAERIPITRDDKEYQDAVTRAAIIMIPTMFREKIGNIFKESKENEESDEMPSPVIKYSGQLTEAAEFQIAVDGVVVATSEDIISSFSCYMAAIYTFNMHNPRCLAKTALFVERVILDLEDNQSIQPLQNVVSKLVNLLE
ncbi:uncharacterized protein LOC121426075 isoform X2 [Lytechinus variegatus]|uniref:uncharacterized protein LOC121405744 n=2 Tax=Lytechinus variegatus TaxID=7654 RepID=UPI001BB0EE5A|nr:uncharacterized protein LOC121405744 [Lytechinus variegatus]XP_041458820.1 uncharacterized protein LOC121410656 isoform X2 [Lytechinus variegatus]XP_041471567.1 uncharacterized protein LOC121421035 [Lytechinus variegatus]XP_041471610.1 uncharacterized protein LOC121421064 [Lytechinus variegatus]XP_041478159.1 uncharacterized protein LOC121426075 isoform X2 [Lytechinus variegatus]